MTWAGISSTDASPSWFSEVHQKDPSAQWERLQFHIGEFVDQFVMVEFDIERSWREQLEQRRQQSREQQREQQRPSIDMSHSDQAANAQEGLQDTVKTPGMSTVESVNLNFISH